MGNKFAKLKAVDESAGKALDGPASSTLMFAGPVGEAAAGTLMAGEIGDAATNFASHKLADATGTKLPDEPPSAPSAARKVLNASMIVNPWTGPAYLGYKTVEPVVKARGGHQFKYCSIFICVLCMLVICWILWKSIDVSDTQQPNQLFGVESYN
jgi:hypothetical protein